MRRWPSQPLAPPREARQNFLFRYKHFAFLFFYLFFFPVFLVLDCGVPG